jgi:hypothetical protein
MIDKLVYNPNPVTPNIYGDSFSLYEDVGKAFVKVNEVTEVVNNMLTTGIQKPLSDALQLMADDGRLGALVKEVVVFDGGVF